MRQCSIKGSGFEISRAGGGGVGGGGGGGGWGWAANVCVFLHHTPGPVHHCITNVCGHSLAWLDGVACGQTLRRSYGSGPECAESIGIAGKRERERERARERCGGQLRAIKA